ncbi:MAG: hypothetical protein CMJ58_19670 [Planctomycetaceae bacterium]|nr:hypothetical protein [Planctomycetaceae bacterium]
MRVRPHFDRSDRNEISIPGPAAWLGLAVWQSYYGEVAATRATNHVAAEPVSITLMVSGVIACQCAVLTSVRRTTIKK